MIYTLLVLIFFLPSIMILILLFQVRSLRQDVNSITGQQDTALSGQQGDPVPGLDPDDGQSADLSGSEDEESALPRPAESASRPYEIVTDDTDTDDTPQSSPDAASPEDDALAQDGGVVSPGDDATSPETENPVPPASTAPAPTGVDESAGLGTGSAMQNINDVPDTGGPVS